MFRAGLSLFAGSLAVAPISTVFHSKAFFYTTHASAFRYLFAQNWAMN